jgi:hypothetical protein
MPVSQQTHADLSAPTISQIGVHPPTHVFLQNEPKFLPCPASAISFIFSRLQATPASSYLAKRTDISPVRLCRSSLPQPSVRALVPSHRARRNHPRHLRNEPIWARPHLFREPSFQPLGQKPTGGRRSPNQPISRLRYFLKRTFLFDCSGSTFLVHFGILRASKG